MERIINYRTYGETVLHPLALILTITMGIVIVLGHRRLVVICFLLPSFLITMLQRIVLFGLDFNMVRILIVFGWIRLLFRGELFNFKINVIDKLLICWVLSSVFIYTLQWKSLSAFTYRIGIAYTVFGIYFLFRHIIKDFNDIHIAIKYLSWICLIICISMIIEKITAYNIFSIFGGLPENPLLREGRLRCQAAFTHPILAGTFGATLVPIFIPYVFEKNKKKIIGFIGILAGITITILSGSSGPILTLLSGLSAVAIFPLRKYVKILILGGFFSLILLQIVMKSPIWFLIGRIGVIEGSTGYHRAILIDKAIANFSEWWLLGVKSSAHWFWGGQDVTNQFILEAINGGLLTLIFFILMLIACTYFVLSFQKTIIDKKESFLVWGLGSSFFSHLISFMGVPYFDQIVVEWYLLIAIIAAIPFKRNMIKENLSNFILLFLRFRKLN